MVHTDLWAEMPSAEPRVYVASYKEAPDDAIVREGTRGRLFYRPSERGQNHHTGGDKDNRLLESGQDDLRQKTSEGTSGMHINDKFDPLVNGHSSNPPENELYCEDHDASFEIGEGDDWSCPHCNEYVVPEKMRGGETEKERRYIEDPSEAPDWAEVQEGVQGGYFYETDEASESQSYEEAQDALDEELAGGHTVRDVATGMAEEAIDEMVGGAWEYDSPQVVAEALNERVRSWGRDNLDTEQEAELMAEEAVTHFEDYVTNEMSRSVDKRRVYIGDPDEAPDDVSVQEGERGGYYYETGDTQEEVDGGSEGVDPEELWQSPIVEYDQLSDQDLEEYEEFLWDQHRQARDADDDEGMMDALSELMEVDQTMQERQEGDSVENSQRVYVADKSEVPEDKTAHSDEQGVFYNAYDAAQRHYPDGTEQELQDETDVDPTDPERAGDGVQSEELAEQMREDLADEARDEFGKRRVYIDDPSQAPEWADVQEGDRGGFFYETEDALDQSPVDEQQILDTAEQTTTDVLEDWDDRQIAEDPEGFRDSVYDGMMDTLNEAIDFDELDGTIQGGIRETVEGVADEAAQYWVGQAEEAVAGEEPEDPEYEPDMGMP